MSGQVLVQLLLRAGASGSRRRSLRVQDVCDVHVRDGRWICLRKRREHEVCRGGAQDIREYLRNFDARIKSSSSKLG
jgi:hypothetical protein